MSTVSKKLVLTIGEFDCVVSVTVRPNKCGTY